VTGQEIIGGLLPTNRFADEVLSDHPSRVRAVWVDSNNPANTAADTPRFEEAFRALDLSVVVDVAYTETAALAEYVLPAASQYEKWECTFFTFEWPRNFFQLRAPLFEPLAGTLPEPEIYARLLGAMGVLPPDGVLTELSELAARDRAAMLGRASQLFGEDPKLARIAAVLLYRTLGPRLPDGAAAAAPLWAPAIARPPMTRAPCSAPSIRRRRASSSASSCSSECWRAARASSSPHTSTTRSGAW
jgi:Molybdopterin oxidoreductase